MKDYGCKVKTNNIDMQLSATVNVYMLLMLIYTNNYTHHT